MKMTCQVWTIAIVALLGCFPAQARADSIALRDGRLIQGKFAGGTQGVIAFAANGTTEYYEVDNIIMMTFGDDDANSQTRSTQPNAVGRIPTLPSEIPQPSSHKSDPASPAPVEESLRNKLEPIRTSVEWTPQITERSCRGRFHIYDIVANRIEDQLAYGM